MPTSKKVVHHTVFLLLFQVFFKPIRAVVAVDQNGLDQSKPNQQYKSGPSAHYSAVLFWV